MEKTAFDVIYYLQIIFCGFGIVINLLLIHALWRLKMLNKASFRFVSCLCVSDTLFCATFIAVQAIDFFGRLSSCIQAIWGFFWLLSPLITLIIAIDRLIRMKYLLRYNTIMTTCRANGLLVAGIILAAQYPVVEIYNSFAIKSSSKKTNASIIYELVIQTIVGFFFLSIFIIYLWTYISVRKQVADLTSIHSAGPVPTQGNQISDRGRELARRRRRDDVNRAIIYVILGLFFLCYPDLISTAYFQYYTCFEDAANISSIIYFLYFYSRPANILNCSFNALMLIFCCKDIRTHFMGYVHLINVTAR